VARDKRKSIMETARELAKITNAMGRSLRELYLLFSIHEPELLWALIGLHSSKGHFLEVGIVTPLFYIEGPNEREGRFRLAYADVDSTAMRAVAKLRWEDGGYSKEDAARTISRYFASIEVDEEKARVVKMLEESRIVINQMSAIKERLGAFIKTCLTIEDFFR